MGVLAGKRLQSAGVRLRVSGGAPLNVYKLWALMGVYWFLVCIFAGFQELYDLAFILTFIGYWVSWLLVAVSAVAVLGKRLHLKDRIKGWFKE